MNVDIGNALASVASPGVSRKSLERLDEQVAAAHERIERGMANEEHGYEALNLPERTDPDEIRARRSSPSPTPTRCSPSASAAVRWVRRRSRTRSTRTPKRSFWITSTPSGSLEPPRGTPLENTAINVVSRSGTTAETLANFLVVREALESAGVDWTERTIVTTGKSGPLRNLADRHDLPSLNVPDGVPGRFSALSAVGMVAAGRLRPRPRGAARGRGRRARDADGVAL